MKGSLSLRLLISASIVLTAFLGLAGGVLERAFREGAEQAMRERLRVHIYALLTAAELSPAGRIQLPQSLPEARFSNPGSGLYGYVFGSESQSLWNSVSSIGIDIAYLDGVQAGQPMFVQDDLGKYILYYKVVWVSERGQERNYLFVVAEDKSALLNQISGFQHTLWFWLGGVGLLLLIVQLGVFRWSLKPLRKIAKDLEAIELGEKNRLDEQYPMELQGLAVNLNALLNSERSHLERYRNTLADLAHSLKTPLAILRGCSENQYLSKQLKSSIDEQVGRMDEIVEYQLKRAAARGHKTLSTQLRVLPIIRKIVSALEKVYAAKRVQSRIHCETENKFCGEEGDIYEIAGNLIDNAYKWCASKVDISIDFISDQTTKVSGLRMIVEDDGPGIPQDKIGEILGRGIRADERTHGHGIGLAVVNDLTQLLNGELKTGTSRYGGARWEVWLPGAYLPTKKT